MHHPQGYTVPEAIARFCDGLLPLETVRSPLDAAHGAALGCRVVAPHDVPDSPRSAVDGYALRAAETKGASAERPCRLRLAGSALAGHPSAEALASGCAVRITTGGVVPPSADAVQYQEVCRVVGDFVEVAEGVEPGDNLRPAGEDVRAGQELLPQGARLTPQRLGLLAALGISQVDVRRRAKVRFVSTGDEIFPLGATAPRGGTYDSNSHQIAAVLRELGADVECVGPVQDRTEAIAAACSGDFDLLLTSGGVSVGPADRIGEVAAALGAEVRFHWARIRPGAPTMGLRIGGRPWLGLSGNPLSAQVGFDLFGRAALAALAGTPSTARRVRARLREGLRRHPPDAPRYLCAHLAVDEGTLFATIHPYQASGGLSALAQTNGYVVQPEGMGELKAGDLVDALWVQPFWG